MRRIFILIALLPSIAFAQSGKSPIQSGNVTPGHPAYWISNGVIGDGGNAQNGNITSLGVTNNGGPAICVNSAPTTSTAYNQLCFATTTNVGTTISSYSYGTATHAGFTFNVNGSTQGFPLVTLPVVNNDNACFDGTTGQLKDCGGVAPTVTLPVTSGNTACWSGTAGNLKDCGGAGAPRTKLVANTTRYVRSDGNDTNCDGSANVAFSAPVAPACAMSTWNGLYTKAAQTLDFDGYTLTLTSGTVNTYTSGLSMAIAWVGGGELVIDLNGSTIAETTTKAIINRVVQPGAIGIQNGSVSTTSGSCIENSAPSVISLGPGMTIGNCAEYDFEAIQGGQIYTGTNPYTVKGGGSTGAHFYAAYGGFIAPLGSAATFNANQTYSLAFAITFLGGTIKADGWSAVLGGHTITGPRYDAQLGGSIYTNNAGSTFFPGTTAGTVEPGGCYDLVCGAGTFNGGTAANSGITLVASTNAAPSGDFIDLQADIISLGPATGGGATTINLGSAGAPSATLNFTGSTSGLTGVKASAIASGTLTLPAATDTLVARSTTDTLTNKTIYGGSAVGSSQLINGTSNGAPSNAYINLQSNGQFVSIGNITPKTFLDNNQNLVTSPALVVSSSLARTQQVDGTSGGVEWVSYGNGAGPPFGNALAGAVAGGTAASPTGTPVSYNMFNLRGYGYNSGWQQGGIISIVSAEQWSAGHQGTRSDFYTTPLASTTVTLAATVNPSGGMNIGGTPVDGGTGTLNLKKQTFASLTSCAAGIEGTLAAVTDSTTATWGANIAGSSTNHVLAYCDGTNWTVAGK